MEEEDETFLYTPEKLESLSAKPKEIKVLWDKHVSDGKVKQVCDELNKAVHAALGAKQAAVRASEHIVELSPPPQPLVAFTLLKVPAKISKPSTSFGLALVPWWLYYVQSGSTNIVRELSEMNPNLDALAATENPSARIAHYLAPAWDGPGSLDVRQTSKTPMDNHNIHAQDFGKRNIPGLKIQENWYLYHVGQMRFLDALNQRHPNPFSEVAAALKKEEKDLTDGQRKTHKSSEYYEHFMAIALSGQPNTNVNDHNLLNSKHQLLNDLNYQQAEYRYSVFGVMTPRSHDAAHEPVITNIRITYDKADSPDAVLCPLLEALPNEGDEPKQPINQPIIHPEHRITCPWFRCIESPNAGATKVDGVDGVYVWVHRRFTLTGAAKSLAESI